MTIQDGPQGSRGHLQWKFDFASESWSFVPASTASPPGRFDHAMVAFGGSTLIALGGKDAQGTALQDIWAFDISTSAWTQVGTLMEPAFGLAAAAVGSDVYVLGGYNGAGASAHFTKCSASGHGTATFVSCLDITEGCALELGCSPFGFFCSPFDN